MVTKTLPLSPIAVAILAASLFLACDKADPVAPAGTLLTVSVNPTKIAVDGTATVTVTAVKPNGTPVTPGTPIGFSTSLGTIGATAPTNAQGVAEAVLRGDGRRGTAMVTVRTGSVEAQTTEVTIGLASAQLTLQATPSTVAETGARVELLSIAFDDDGNPLANAQVVFSAEVGRLDSGGSIVTTNSEGEARDSLRISEAELNALTVDSFQITATSPGGSAGSATANVTIRVQRKPVANFIFTVTRLSVAFSDTSTGNPTSWFWDFGDGTTSQSRNPTHTYSVAGTYLVTLQATNSAGSDSITKAVTVSTN